MNANSYLDSLSDEERKKLLESAYELKRKIEQKENKKIDIKSSDTYITWLTGFLSVHEYFTTDSFLYDDKGLSESDLSNVKDLDLFFEVVNEYADANFIRHLKSTFGGCYLVKYHDITFDIGFAAGQGSFCFCELADLNKDEFVIDYEDILNNKPQENTEMIQEHIQKIVDEINSLSQYVYIPLLLKIIEAECCTIKDEENNK